MAALAAARAIQLAPPAGRKPHPVHSTWRSSRYAVKPPAPNCIAANLAPAAEDAVLSIKINGIRQVNLNMSVVVAPARIGSAPLNTEANRCSHSSMRERLRRTQPTAVAQSAVTTKQVSQVRDASS